MGNACAFEGVDAGAEPGGFASPPCTFEEFSASIETPQAASTEFRECAAYRVWRAPSAKPSSWSGISCLSEDAGTGSAKRCFELPDLDAKDCYVVMEVLGLGPRARPTPTPRPTRGPMNMNLQMHSCSRGPLWLSLYYYAYDYPFAFTVLHFYAKFFGIGSEHIVLVDIHSPSPCPRRTRRGRASRGH